MPFDFNPNYPPAHAHLRAWIARHPADQAYEWDNVAVCLFTQYAKEAKLERTHQFLTDTPFNRALDKFGTAMVAWVGMEKPRTYGAAVERLDAWLAAHPLG